MHGAVRGALRRRVRRARRRAGARVHVLERSGRSEDRARKNGGVRRGDSTRRRKRKRTPRGRGLGGTRERSARPATVRSVDETPAEAAGGCPRERPTTTTTDGGDGDPRGRGRERERPPGDFPGEARLARDSGPRAADGFAAGAARVMLAASRTVRGGDALDLILRLFPGPDISSPSADGGVTAASSVAWAARALGPDEARRVLLAGDGGPSAGVRATAAGCVVTARDVFLVSRLGSGSGGAGGEAPAGATEGIPIPIPIPTGRSRWRPGRNRCWSGEETRGTRAGARAEKEIVEESRGGSSSSRKTSGSTRSCPEPSWTPSRGNATNDVSRRGPGDEEVREARREPRVRNIS